MNKTIRSNRSGHKPARYAAAGAALLSGVLRRRLLAAAVAAAMPALAQADVLQWNNDTGGSFQDALNWVVLPAAGTTGVPGAADTAAFASPDLNGDVTLEKAASVRNLYVYTGDVRIDLAGYALNLSNEMVVAAMEESAAPSLTIKNTTETPAVFFTPRIQVGDNGNLSVTGETTRVTSNQFDAGIESSSAPAGVFVNAGATLKVDGSMNLGASGVASLEVSAGGILEASSSYFTPLVVAANPGTGTPSSITVTGEGSKLTGNHVILGAEGNGDLAISGGATAQLGSLTAGRASTASGDVVVTGANSQLNVDNIRLGEQGAGSLTIDDGASVHGSITMGANGTIDFKGGLLQAGGTISQALVVGDGVQEATLTAKGLYATHGITLSDNARLEIDQGSLQTTTINKGDGEVLFKSGGISLMSNLTIGGNNGLFDDADLQSGPVVLQKKAGEVFHRQGITTTLNLTVDDIQLTVGDGGSLSVKTLALAGEGSVTLGNKYTFNLTGQDLTIGSGGLLDQDVNVSNGTRFGVGNNKLTVDGKTISISNGGEFTVGELELANGAIVDFQGGEFTVNTGDLEIGAAGLTRLVESVPSSVVAVSWGSRLSVTGSNLHIADGHTLAIEGGRVSARTLSFGEGASITFSGHSSETLSIHESFDVNVFQADGDLAENARVIAGTVVRGDGSSAVQMTRGQLDTKNIGGAFEYTSGDLTVRDGLIIGGEGGITGVNGNSTVVVAGTYQDVETEEDEPTTVRQLVRTNSLASGRMDDGEDFASIWDRAITIRSGHTLTLAEGGVLSASSLNRESAEGGEETGAFEWTGGRLNVMSDLVIGNNSFFGDATTIEVDSGKYLDVRGYASFSSQEAGHGTINVEEGSTFRVRRLLGQVQTAGDGEVIIREQYFGGGGGYIQSTDIIAEQIAVAGALSLSSNFQVVGNLILDSGGTLKGTAKIQGTGTIQGLISPGNSPGTLEFTQGYTQGSNGVYLAEVGREDDALVNDLILVSGGLARLGGTLELNLLEGYVPSLNDEFTILDALPNALRGAFAALILPEIDGILKWATIYDRPNGDVLVRVVPFTFDSEFTIVPEPGALSLLALGGLTMLRRRRGGWGG